MMKINSHEAVSAGAYRVRVDAMSATDLTPLNTVSFVVKLQARPHTDRILPLPINSRRELAPAGSGTNEEVCENHGYDE